MESKDWFDPKKTVEMDEMETEELREWMACELSKKKPLRKTAALSG